MLLTIGLHKFHLGFAAQAANSRCAMNETHCHQFTYVCVITRLTHYGLPHSTYEFCNETLRKMNSKYMQLQVIYVVLVGLQNA